MEDIVLPIYLLTQKVIRLYRSSANNKRYTKAPL